MQDEGIDLKLVTHWECPEDNGPAILTMPNVPHALHGHGLQPRTILGRTTWDHMRKKCYYDAGYKSEVSGVEPPKGQLHAHELFSYDYEKQEGVFIRCVALAKIEHDFIHSGRLLTLFRRGNPLYPKSYVLNVIENGFNIISTYNREHPDEEPLRCFATFLSALEIPDLMQEVDELIKRYGIKFYGAKLSEHKKWKGWHVIIGNSRYGTPYESQSDWEKAMELENNRNDHNIENPFKGEGYDEVDAILKGRVENTIAGCKSGRISKRKENDND